jgi:hypothetical protein
MLKMASVKIHFGKTWAQERKEKLTESNLRKRSVREHSHSEAYVSLEDKHTIWERELVINHMSLGVYEVPVDEVAAGNDGSNGKGV